MTPQHGSSTHSRRHGSSNSRALACAGCGQSLYPDQPMVARATGGALHVGCDMLEAIQFQHGSDVLLGETLPRLGA
jgi:hypothetical protein